MSDKYHELRGVLLNKFAGPTEVEEDEDVEETELVSHPAHYNHGEYETIDVIEDWNLGFHCGNAIKYISRHAHKGAPIRDIEKAIWYLERYLDTLQEEE